MCVCVCSHVYELDESSWNPSSDRPQHDLPAAGVIAQQYSFATLVSFRFHNAINMNRRAVKILLFHFSILGARKISKSDYLLRHVCMSACPSVLLEHFGSHWTDLYESWYLSSLQKPKKVQTWFNSFKNNRYLTQTRANFWYHVPELFLQWEMFQTKFVEKIETQFNVQ
jgi:hypothetical protein